MRPCFLGTPISGRRQKNLYSICGASFQKSDWEKNADRLSLGRNIYSLKRAIGGNSAVFGILLLLMFTNAVSGGSPSLTGMPGLVHIPSADFMRDGVIYGGVNLIPRQALPYSHYSNDGLVVFGAMTFLPFLEFDLRLTKQLGIPPSQHHTVDRSPSVRLKILRDKGWRPAVVIGFQDIFSTVERGEARHFGSTFIVATKIYKINNILISPTLGYGLSIIKASQYEFIGLFGGAKFQLFSQRQFALSIEYDSASVNVGADISMLEMMNLKCAVLDLKYFSIGASMHFNLFGVF